MGWKIWMFVVAVVIGLTTPPRVQADILPSHSLVWTSFPDFNRELSIEGTRGGDTGLQFHDFSGSGIRNGGAHATANLDAAHLLAGGSTASTSYGGAGRAWSSAVSFWRDITFVSGDQPNAIRLHFHVEGTFTVSHLGIATLHVMELRAGDGYIPLNTVGSAELRGDFVDYMAPTYTNSFWTDGFDAFTMSATGGDAWAFSATLHLDILYNASVGGYVWGLGLEARSVAIRSVFDVGGPTFASMNALNSVGLVAVTDLDGNPLTVTFDSGLRLEETANVPEPTTLSMWAIGAVGGALVTFVRRRRVVPSRD